MCLLWMLIMWIAAFLHRVHLGMQHKPLTVTNQVQLSEVIEEEYDQERSVSPDVIAF